MGGSEFAGSDVTSVGDDSVGDGSSYDEPSGRSVSSGAGVRSRVRGASAGGVAGVSGRPSRRPAIQASMSSVSRRGVVLPDAPSAERREPFEPFDPDLCEDPFEADPFDAVPVDAEPFEPLPLEPLPLEPFTPVA